MGATITKFDDTNGLGRQSKEIAMFSDFIDDYLLMQGCSHKFCSGNKRNNDYEPYIKLLLVDTPLFILRY